MAGRIMTAHGSKMISFVAALGVVALFHDSSAAERANSAVTGLYVQIEMTGGGGKGPFSTVNSTRKNYLYLFPDGTFYEGFVSQGYDELDFPKYLSQQHPLRVARDTGRYTVNGNEVTFRYAGGGETVRNYEGNALDPGFFQYARQPNCDELKLNGMYQPAGFATGIMFTPDGKFVDRGIVATLTETQLVGLRMHKDEPRPGAGMYQIKNHTLTLRYANGHVSRLFVYVNGDEHGDLDPRSIHVNHTQLIRQGGSFSATQPLPVARLPKIGVPPGWKIGRDGRNKNLTYVVPADLARGQEIRVLVADAERLPEGKTIVAPDRFHDAMVQHSVKGMAAKGGRIAKTFTSESLGKTRSSTGMLTETSGKNFRMTIFTPMSNLEAQLVVYMAESDNLYASYLPAVKAMLGEGDPSLQADMTSLDTLLVKMCSDLKALNGWVSEYDLKEEATQFTPPNLPDGHIVAVVVDKRQKLGSPLSQAHDESVRKTIANLEKENGRLEETPMREEQEGHVFSSLRGLLSNGMRIWVMTGNMAVGDEVQEVSLLANNEDLYKQYLPTLKATLVEVAGR